MTQENQIIVEKDGSLTINVYPTTESNSIIKVVPEFKDLTDEQILEIWRENERVYPIDRSRLLDRSRAILRKAQEK
jgi:hypothetical protein